MKTLLIAVAISSVSFAASAVEWSELEARFRQVGGNIKSLRHVQCFLEGTRGQQIEFKKPSSSGYNQRCYSKGRYELGKQDVFAIIDYTKASNTHRMFLINKKTGNIKSMPVAHGRFEANHMNGDLSHNKNSVKWARYYSNKKGSNAPSSGFYMAGQEYTGKWGRSLIVHGISKGVNDNACERAVVIHKHKLVTKNKAWSMSSGCPMVSKKNIDTVINTLKGKQSGMSLESTGSLVYIYSQREQEWGDAECGRFTKLSSR